MIDGVIGLIVGLVGILMWVNFYGSANTDGLDTNTEMVLDMVPVFLGIAMLYGAIRLITSSKSKLGQPGMLGQSGDPVAICCEPGLPKLKERKYEGENRWQVKN